MKTAIVILNYNDTATTLSCLQAIEGYAVYDHIVVVDNASTDPATAEIEARCSSMGADFVRAARNRGYACGNNVGIRYAMEQHGVDVVFVSNPDVICSEASARAILNAFSDHERIGVASGLIHVYDADRRLRVYSSFAYRTPKVLDMMLNCFLVATKIRRKLGKAVYYDPAEVKRNGYLYAEVLSGCFFAISREAYTAIGGLDEDTFLYNEEAILGARLKTKGFRGVVVDAQVIHDEKQDKAAGWKKQWRTGKLIRESARVYMKKYLGCSGLTLAAYSAANVLGLVERYLITLVLG